MAGFDWNSIGSKFGALQGDPMLHMGMGLLQAGQWSDKPQGIGSGLLAGMQSYQAAAANQQAMKAREMQMQQAQAEIDDKKALREMATRYLKPSQGILGYGVEAGTDQAKGLLQPSGNDEFDAFNLAATNDALNSNAPAGKAEAVQGPRGPDIQGYLNARMQAGLIDPLEVQKMQAAMRPKINKIVETANGAMPIFDDGQAGAQIEFERPTDKANLVQAKNVNGEMVWITPQQALDGGFAVPDKIAGQMDGGDQKYLFTDTGKVMPGVTVGMSPTQAGQLQNDTIRTQTGVRAEDRQGQAQDWTQQYQAGQLANDGERIGIAREAEARQQAALGANVQQAQQDYNLAKQRVSLEKQKFGQESEQARAELALKQQELARAQKTGGLKPASAEAAGRIAMATQSIQDVDRAMGMMFDKDGNLNRKLLASARFPGGGFPLDGDAKRLNSYILNAVSGKYRIETGAAGNKDEVEKMAQRFMPGPLDTAASARDKMMRLREFMQETLGSMQRPVPGQPAASQSAAGARKVINVGGKSVTASRAPDGNYYVQQNGKFFRVD